MIDDIAEWDAAYVLGALGRGDRHTYQAYLAANPECAAALTELAGLPGILNVLSRDEAIALTEQAGDAPAEGLTLDLMPSLATAAAMRERRSRRSLAAVGWPPRPPSRSGPVQWAPPCFRGPDNLPWRRWS